jgi:hypothetical protein
MDTHQHIKEMAPTSELDRYILNEMALKAADGVGMQCGREYWGDERPARATELYKLTPEELHNLPTKICNLSIVSKNLFTLPPYQQQEATNSIKLRE